MSPILGWALAVIAVAIGWARWGWQGALVALSVVVFWLLLQFSRALRSLRTASSRPVGSIGNAVMLNAKLRAGMPLVQVLKLTGSLGERQPDAGAGADVEAWVWRDGGGDAVRVELTRSRVSAWRLLRAPAADEGL